MTVADTIVGGWAPGSQWLLTPTPLLGPGQARSHAQRGQARASAEQHPGLHDGKIPTGYPRKLSNHFIRHQV